MRLNRSLIDPRLEDDHEFALAVEAIIATVPGEDDASRQKRQSDAWDDYNNSDPPPQHLMRLLELVLEGALNENDELTDFTRWVRPKNWEEDDPIARDIIYEIVEHEATMTDRKALKFVIEFLTNRPENDEDDNWREDCEEALEELKESGDDEEKRTNDESPDQLDLL